MNVQFWGVELDGERKIHGLSTWQRACLETFMSIRVDMRVFALGLDVDPRAPWEGNWFYPVIPNNEIGFTLVPEQAFGPEEIAARLRDIMCRIRESKTQEEARLAFEEADPFLPYIPIQLAAAFSKGYNTWMRTKDA